MALTLFPLPDNHNQYIFCDSTLNRTGRLIGTIEYTQPKNWRPSRLQLYLTLKESEPLSISRKRPGVEQKGSSKAASIRGQSPAIACSMTLLRTEHVQRLAEQLPRGRRSGTGKNKQKKKIRQNVGVSNFNSKNYKTWLEKL